MPTLTIIDRIDIIMRDGEIRTLNRWGQRECPILHTWGFAHTQEINDLPGLTADLRITRVKTLTLFYSENADRESAWVVIDDERVIVNRLVILAVQRRQTIQAITTADADSDASSDESGGV